MCFLLQKSKKKMREMLCEALRGLLYGLSQKVDVIGHNFNVFSLYVKVFYQKFITLFPVKLH